jgi:DNA-binding NtrC family response regulator
VQALETANQTIVVVGDDPDVLKLIARTLSRNSFRVLDAGSATDGLAAFQARSAPFKLAIIDMMMPHVSGLDLTAGLQRLQPGLKLLNISGHGESIAIESLFRRSPDCDGQDGAFLLND